MTDQHLSTPDESGIYCGRQLDFVQPVETEMNIHHILLFLFPAAAILCAWN